MEEKKELTTQESAQILLNKIKEEGNLLEAQDLVADNQIEFDHNDKKYRVRLLNRKEREELNRLRLQKFGQLITNKDVLLEADLIKVYKERGIDIEKIDEEIKRLDAELLNTRIQLGEALSKNNSESALKGYGEAIDTILEQKQTYMLQKTQMLTMSLENQLLSYVAELITYLTLDVFENDKWARLFKNYDEYMNYKDDKLIDKAGTRSMILQYI